MKSKVINTKLGKIEYNSIGTGIPVVFVHGGHSNCNETLSHKGFDLGKFQLITPSRPGYGQTPLNQNQTPKQAAALIIELVRHLELDQVIVYGISAGGLTAIELTANYPEKVKKLVLASAVSKKWLEANEKTYKTAQRIFSPKMEKVTWGMVKSFAKVFPKMIAKSFFPQFSNSSMHSLQKDEVQELLSAMSQYSSKTGFLNDIDQNIDDNVLAKIKCPTLIVHSKNDNSVPFNHSLHAHHQIENSQLLALDNIWGHLLWIGDDANENINPIIEFITK